MTARMITNIRVTARRWFPGVARGNTLFSAELYINDDSQPALTVEHEYGYGDHYLTVMIGLAVERGILPPCDRPRNPRSYCADNHIELSEDVIDVRRKKDL